MMMIDSKVSVQMQSEQQVYKNSQQVNQKWLNNE